MRSDVLTQFAVNCQDRQYISTYRDKLRSLDCTSKEIRFAFKQIADALNEVLDCFDKLVRLSKVDNREEVTRTVNKMESNMFHAARFLQIFESHPLNWNETQALYDTKGPGDFNDDSKLGLIGIWNKLSEIISNDLVEGFETEEQAAAQRNRQDLEYSYSYLQKLRVPIISVNNLIERSREPEEDLRYRSSRLLKNYAELEISARRDLNNTINDYLVCEVIPLLKDNGIVDPQSISINIVEKPEATRETDPTGAVLEINGEARPEGLNKKLVEHIETKAHQLFMDFYQQRILPYYEQLGDIDFYNKYNYSFSYGQKLVQGPQTNSEPIRSINDLQALEKRLNELRFDYDENLPIDLKRAYHRLQRIIQYIYGHAYESQHGKAQDAAICLRSAYINIQEALAEMSEMSSQCYQGDENLDECYQNLADNFLGPITELLSSGIPQIDDSAEDIASRAMTLNTEELTGSLRYPKNFSLEVGFSQNKYAPGFDSDELASIISQELDNPSNKVERVIAGELMAYIAHEYFPSVVCGALSQSLNFQIETQDWDQVLEYGLRPDDISLSTDPRGLTNGSFDPDPIVVDLCERLRFCLNHYVIPKLVKNQRFREMAPKLSLRFNYNIQEHLDLINSITDGFWHGDRNSNRPDLPFPPKFSEN